MKKLTQFLFLLSAVCMPVIVFAQGFSVSGSIHDAKDASALIGVSVSVINITDSTKNTGAVTDVNGNFTISNVLPGNYKLTAAYIGYKPYSKTISVVDKNVSAGNIMLQAGANVLKGVTIEGKQIRAEQLGDTSQFNADAYKVHPDATAEDLVTKMPGVTSDGNGVKVNGETVQQVYVDGKPFFGTDPTLALKNLPAEVIDKIQVFDKQSDQSTFTGFDDGNSQKTINVVTKKNRRNGEFGKVYGGYGTDDRYLVGGSMNYFDGDRRISVIELSNNVNQQNFSSQDILGVSGSSGRNRGGSGGGGSFGGGAGGGSSANNFLVGQSGGIATTHSAGINYSDTWGKKVKVTGSYFFNYTDNINNTQLERDYFTKSDTTLHYTEKDNTETKNINHRFNLRFEYDIDSFNTLFVTPSLNVQFNNAYTGQMDSSFLDNALSSRAANTTNANYSGYTFSNNLLYQHKFHKPRRTVSLGINTSVNEKSGTGSYYSDTRYIMTDSISESLLDQQYTLYNNSSTLSANLNYTEPIGKKGQLQLNYYPSYTKGAADKETYNRDNTTQQYTDFDTLLSNKYHNTYFTQQAGLNYRIGDRKLNFMAGANYQYAILQGDQYFPTTYGIDKYFNNILPQAMFNYRFADGRNLHIFYRTNTTAPSISQLQDVVDVSNPLLLKTGNPDLKQDFEQNIMVRYGLTKKGNAHSFFLFANANFISNYIGNATYSPTKDSSVSEGIALNRGSQLTVPVNLSGYQNHRIFITYGLPADFIKSNLNFNGGLTFTRQPGSVNNELNYSNNYAPTAGVVLSSNISQNIDFTLSYTGNYNFISNTLTSQANTDYYSHTASFRINYITLKKLVINTNITHTYYSTLTGTAANESYILWNAYIGYKLLKKDALEVRLSAFDLLNQNKSVARTVTDTYIENSITEVLKQYFMLNLTYTVRNYKGAAPDEGQQNRYREHFRPGQPDGNGPPPGGGYGPPPGGSPPGGGGDHP